MMGRNFAQQAFSILRGTCQVGVVDWRHDVSDLHESWHQGGGVGMQTTPPTQKGEGENLTRGSFSPSALWERGANALRSLGGLFRQEPAQPPRLMNSEVVRVVFDRGALKDLRVEGADGTGKKRVGSQLAR